MHYERARGAPARGICARLNVDRARKQTINEIRWLLESRSITLCCKGLASLVCEGDSRRSQVSCQAIGDANSNSPSALIEGMRQASINKLNPPESDLHNELILL